MLSFSKKICKIVLKNLCGNGREIVKKNIYLRQIYTQLLCLFTAVSRYWYGMPTEEFDDVLMVSYENGRFIPKYEREMNIIRESQRRIRERQALPVSQAQFQGECYSCEEMILPK